MTSMQTYVSTAILLCFVGCKKRPQDQQVVPFTPPSCEENPLFCDDDLLDDLPEAVENQDTGEQNSEDL